MNSPRADGGTSLPPRFRGSVAAAPWPLPELNGEIGLGEIGVDGREEGARTSTRVDPVARNSEAYNPCASKRACVSSDPFIPPRSESD